MSRVGFTVDAVPESPTVLTFALCGYVARRFAIAAPVNRAIQSSISER